MTGSAFDVLLVTRRSPLVSAFWLITHHSSLFTFSSILTSFRTRNGD